MAGSTLSRRFSEVVGVALSALSLIWLIALVSYSASDPVWFFNTGSDLPPANFAGRIGAFLAELSFQLVGYAAYLAPGGDPMRGSPLGTVRSGRRCLCRRVVSCALMPWPAMS